MFVAIPTAMPEPPLTSRFGKRAGRTTGSCLAVVVRREVDGVHVEVAQHLHRDPGQPGLGVPHGSGRVVVDRAEVALAVDQLVAHREVLGHAHQGVVDGGVAVGVVLADHLADDLARTWIGAVGPEAELVIA